MANKLLKKTLIGAAVAIMACTSMNAMAEEQWTYIRLPTSIEGHPGARTLNETCTKVARHWTNDIFSYKAVNGKHGAWQNWWSPHTGGINCYVMDNLGENGSWRDSGAPTYTGSWYCDESQHFRYNPDNDTIGCYEFKEVEFAMNHESCNGKDYPNENGRRPLGGVTCDNPDGQQYTCFWPENIRDNTDNKQEWDEYDDTAKGIIEKCTRMHEQNHIDDNEREHICMDGRDGRKNPVAGWFSERDAYQVEMTCLTDNISSCTNDKCMEEIGEAYNNAATEFNKYDGCTKDPSSCR